MAKGGNGGDGNGMPEDDVAAQNASARQYDWRPRPDPTVLTTQQLRETEAALNRTIKERINGLRELQEQRLDGMDRATELVAARVVELIEESKSSQGRVRSEFAAADQSLRELLTGRIEGMDKANELLAADVGKFPSDIDRAVSSLKGLLISEMQRVQAVLTGETRRVEAVAQEKFGAIDGLFNSNDKALTAALAAQEKAAAEQQKSNTLAIDKSEKTTIETIRANDDKTASAIKAQSDTIADLKDRVVRIEATGVGVTSVTGSPYESALLRQADEHALEAERQARVAQARAVLALVISGVLVLITLASVIFAATKK